MEPRTPRPASARTTTCIAVPDLLLGLSKLTKVCAAPPLGCDAGGGGGAKLPGSVNAGGYDEKLVVQILLEAVEALRSAYVKLQRAHVPYYDPAKIAVADEAVAALQCLCSSTSGGGGGVAKLVDERWSLVQRLEGETRKREVDIVVLRRELEGLRRASSRLGKQIRMSRASVWHGKVAVVRRELTTTAAATSLGAVLELFMAAAAAAAVHGLAELISASFAAAAASSSDRCTRNGDERCRGRYSLEAHLWRTMLGGGGGVGCTGEEEEEGFDAARFDRIMRRRDPFDALAEQHPSSGGLARFCRSRYLAAVSPEAERAVLCNLDQRAFVSRGGDPRTWSYRAFATAAPRGGCSGGSDSDAVRMFYARGGSRYSAEHMRSVVAAAGREGGDEKRSVVAFTVAPGLSAGGAVAVACMVFLCDPEDADDVQNQRLTRD